MDSQGLPWIAYFELVNGTRVLRNQEPGEDRFSVVVLSPNNTLHQLPIMGEAESKKAAFELFMNL